MNICYRLYYPNKIIYSFLSLDQVQYSNPIFFLLVSKHLLSSLLSQQNHLFFSFFRSSSIFNTNIPVSEHLLSSLLSQQNHLFFSFFRSSSIFRTNIPVSEHFLWTLLSQHIHFFFICLGQIQFLSSIVAVLVS